jgi:hypothetical protein
VVINTVDETRIINAKGNSVPSSILTNLTVCVRILNDETNYDLFLLIVIVLLIENKINK